METTTRSWSSTSSSGGRTASAEVAWAGELRPDWPVDGAFSASWSSGQSMGGTTDRRAWDDGACAWSWSDTHEDVVEESVTMQGRTFLVREYASTCGPDHDGAFVDDAYVGVVDPDTWVLLATDDDGDGWAEPADCDDADPAANPCGTDVFYDGVDGDCDGESDYDADADGWDAEAYGGRDCDDTTSAVHPGVLETWYDGVDADCDGASDFDADADGHDAEAYAGDDCDDADDDVSPDAPEVDCDGVDQDCDGADACADTGAAPSTGDEPPVREDAPRRGCGEGMGALVVLPFLRRRRARVGRTAPPP